MMEQHEGNRERDKRPIHPPDPFHRRILASCRFSDMNRPNGKSLASAWMAGPACLTEVCGVHRRARIVRWKNIVYAMARSAIRNGLRTGSRRQPVKAVRECGHTVGWKVVASFDPFVAMAPPAGKDRNARGVNRRQWIPRGENGMLPMTIGAHWRVGSALCRGFSVNGLVIDFLDSSVAGAAGCRNVPMICLGKRIASGKNTMAGMAIRAGWRGRIAGRECASMHAEPKRFHGMCEGDFVPGEKIRIGMTGSTCVRKILFGHRRERVADA
jgi:hypothetical protein